MSLRTILCVNAFVLSIDYLLIPRQCEFYLYPLASCLVLHFYL